MTCFGTRLDVRGTQLGYTRLSWLSSTRNNKNIKKPQSGSNNKLQKWNIEVFRESARKAKAQLQLKLVMDMNNKRSFYHYISIKPLNMENTGYLLNGDCDLETVGLGKAEVLHNFVTLSFSDMIPGLNSPETILEWVGSGQGSPETSSHANPRHQMRY